MDKIKVIKVPDVPHPTAKLCYAQAPTMERCDRRAGHGGLHTWEAYALIQRLQAEHDVRTAQQTQAREANS